MNKILLLLTAVSFSTYSMQVEDEKTALIKSTQTDAISAQLKECEELIMKSEKNESLTTSIFGSGAVGVVTGLTGAALESSPATAAGATMFFKIIPEAIVLAGLRRDCDDIREYAQSGFSNTEKLNYLRSYNTSDAKLRALIHVGMNAAAGAVFLGLGYSGFFDEKSGFFSTEGAIGTGYGFIADSSTRAGGIMADYIKGTRALNRLQKLIDAQGEKQEEV